MDNKTPVVLISGPVGVGKSTVGEELGEFLEHEDIPHTVIDFDKLRYTYPRPADDPWGNSLGLKNLADVWSNCSKSGARNLIISYVVESSSFVEDVRSAIPHSTVSWIQLTASLETLEERVRRREIGSGLEWHMNRAVELAMILDGDDVPCDYRIATDRKAPGYIAREIAELIQWRTD